MQLDRCRRTEQRVPPPLLVCGRGAIHPPPCRAGPSGPSEVTVEGTPPVLCLPIEECTPVAHPSPVPVWSCAQQTGRGPAPPLRPPKPPPPLSDLPSPP